MNGIVSRMTSMANIISEHFKFRYIYKTVNLINGKIYVGSHMTDNIDDGYLGSGVYFKKAVKKYGAVNFKREILEFYLGDNVKEFYDLERKWIKELRASESDIGYNLTQNCGGGYINSETYRMMSVKFKGRVNWCLGLKLSDEHKRKIGRSGDKNPMYGIKGEFHPQFGKVGPNAGKTFTPEHKKKIGDSQRGDKHRLYRGNKEDHPMFGKSQTEESRNKNRESNINKPLIRCPHCGKESISKGTMIQWHFDNCKLK